MVVFDSTLFPQVEALRRLHDSTRKTAQRLKACNIALSTPNRSPGLAPQDVTFAPLNLPVPDEVLAPIIKLNTSERLRNAIRDCFISRITELELKYTTAYHETCTSVMQTARPAAYRDLQTAFLNLYRQQCHTFVEKQLPYVLKEVAKLERHVPRHDTAKTEFNRDYTPILESYFAYNAYPSLPDRLLLARKSAMSPRQIEVWFQNHRNRAKKDGVELRRISPSAPSTFAFDKHVSHAPQVAALRSRSPTADIGPSNEHVPSNNHAQTMLDDSRPPHVFPTPYSAKSGNVPFSPDNHIFEIESRNWLHSPATANRTQHSSTSVDDLIGLFSRMTIHGPVGSSRSSKSATKQRKWALPIVITPFPAPHPAVVNPSWAAPLPTNHTLPSCAWQKLSLCRRKQPISRFKAPYPSWAVPGTPRQKSPCIARRTPPSGHNTYRFAPSLRSSSSTSSISSSSTCSLGSHSTSLSSLSRQTTLELIDVAIESSQPSFTLANNQWDFDFQIETRLSSPSPSQEGTCSPTQSLSLPEFVTMNLPGFTFFES